MFLSCQNFNSSNISSWNTENILNMQGLFAFTNSFNQPLNSWNLSNVTNISEMFKNALAFNQRIYSWNVEKVTDMSYLFYIVVGSALFDYYDDISFWNVKSVTNGSTININTSH